MTRRQFARIVRLRRRVTALGGAAGCHTLAIDQDQEGGEQKDRLSYPRPQPGLRFNLAKRFHGFSDAYLSEYNGLTCRRHLPHGGTLESMNVLPLFGRARGRIRVYWTIGGCRTIADHSSPLSEMPFFNDYRKQRKYSSRPTTWVTLQWVDNRRSHIAEFVKRSKRDRYREFLSNTRLRHKFINQLPHFADFDPKYRLPISSDKLLIENITAELQKRHCPSVVYAISEDPTLDQRELPLTEALNRIVGRGIGTVLSCIPGRLAFVETEDERYILERHEVPEKRSYVRFVVGWKDKDSHVEQGIFQAVAQAIESRSITGSDAKELNELRGWFSENLEAPTSFGRGTLSLGICWFKTGANEHISRVWRIIKVLERNGIYVKKIKTDRPGYLIYEDEWQVVAEPFRKGTMSRHRRVRGPLLGDGFR
jgi:hypothetical protein